MSVVVQHARRIMAETDASILLLHHTGEGNKKKPRGHSSLERGASYVYLAEHRQGTTILTNQKLRSGPSGAILRLPIAVRTLPSGETACVVVESSPGPAGTSTLANRETTSSEPAGGRASGTPTDDEVYAQIRAGVNTQDQLRATFGTSQGTISKALKRL